MHPRHLITLLGLLPLSATAQRLDLGLSGGTRVSFTDALLPYNSGNLSGRARATSAAVGLEASYVFPQSRLRLSTGVVRGELAQALRPDPLFQDGILELRSTAWQVPLRLHTQLFRLGTKVAVGLRNGVVLQLQRTGKPRIGGDYEPGSHVVYLSTTNEEAYNALRIERRGEMVYELTPAKGRKAGGLLLETGAELSYALTPALTLDLSAAYQAGLRQIEAPELYRLDANLVPTQRVLTAGTKGSNLLLSLSARYALRSWEASVD